jgi:hypothetical protein
VFSKFSDSERELLVSRLSDFSFESILQDSGLDLVEGLLVTANSEQGLLLMVDLQYDVDKFSGIPNRYLGYLIDEQVFDLDTINTFKENLIETISAHIDSFRIDEENLDSFSIVLQSNLSLGNTTEKHALAKQRIGQQSFRDSLIKHYGGKCIITGISSLSLLRASHIKPWTKCKSDAERLDVSNGLLLSANYDAAFDAGLITFNKSGGIVYSRDLSASDQLLVSGVGDISICFSAKTENYMSFHRHFVFIG